MSHEKHQQEGKRFHKDWRVWVMVILMLGAIGMYVITLDDSTVPRTIQR